MARLAWLLFATIVVVAHGASSVEPRLARALRGLRTMRDPSFLQTQAHVHSQVEDVLAMFKPKENAATKAKANVALDNSLDLKSLGALYVEGKKMKQPRHVVIAFLSVAWEAIQRGRAAVGQLKAQLQHEEHHLVTESHNLKAWVKNQRAIALHKLSIEKERIGRTMDEASHLRHIYQDAVAKETAYQKQSNFLVAEHQLQSTPPLMPAVAAAALSDTQYRDALNKLDTYRTKALQIIQQTQKGIQTREELIKSGNDWVNRSEVSLKQWKASQDKIVAQRIAERKGHIESVKRRIQNVKTIVADAKAKHSAYLSTLKKLDLKAQIDALKRQQKQYKAVKTLNAYDTGKMRAFLESIKLELNTLEKEYKAAKGAEEVTPPPAAWGVLAGFHPPGLHPATPYPALQLPMFQPPALTPKEAQPVMYPGTTVRAFAGMSQPDQLYFHPYAPVTINDQPVPPNPKPAAPAAAAGAPKFRELPAGVPPPPVDNLPPPPSLDTDLM